jgi:hypothetical protein
MLTLLLDSYLFYIYPYSAVWTFQDLFYPAMVQAISRRHLNKEVDFASWWVHVRFMMQNDTGTGIIPESSVYPCQYYSTVAFHTDISHGGWTFSPFVASDQCHCLTTSIWTTTATWIMWLCIFSFLFFFFVLFLVANLNPCGFQWFL